MIAFESRSARVIVGRLEKGANVHDGLLAVCREFGVTAGTITALGAFDLVQLCEYNQEKQAYEPALTFGGAMEVLHLTGNVSTRDGRPFLHLHAVCSAEKERSTNPRKYIEVFGGHVVTARVFALEFSITALDDVTLTRAHDAATGLSLWQQQAEV